MKVPVHHLVVDEEELRPMDESTKSEEKSAKVAPKIDRPMAVVAEAKSGKTNPPAEILEPTLKVPMSLFLHDKPKDSIPKERAAPRPVPKFDREYQQSVRKERTDKARLVEAKADAVKTREIEIRISLDPKKYLSGLAGGLRRAGQIAFLACHKTFLAADTGFRKFRGLPAKHQLITGVAMVALIFGTVYRSGRESRVEVAPPDSMPAYSNPVSKVPAPTRGNRSSRKAVAQNPKPTTGRAKPVFNAKATVVQQTAAQRAVASKPARKSKLPGRKAAPKAQTKSRR